MQANKEEIFKEHVAQFLSSMRSVEDFYNVVITRSNWHKMEAEMGRKADDYDYFAQGHLSEYLSKYESNEEKDFYPDGLLWRQEKFSFIVDAFVQLIIKAQELGVNIPVPMFYDYCAAVSSLKGVQMAIEQIKEG